MSVTLHTTLGDLKLELACDKAPYGCSNFLAHCGMGTYVKSSFHRNLAGFCIQGGDPTGTGKGGSTWNGKELETEDGLKHDKRGCVALAKVKKQYGSQFYITYAPQSHLDGQFTVIGNVIDGIEVLDALERVPVKGKKYKPTVDIEISGVTIHSNPIAEALVPPPTVDASTSGPASGGAASSGASAASSSATTQVVSKLVVKQDRCSTKENDTFRVFSVCGPICCSVLIACARGAVLRLWEAQA